jgi:hypothetical protein
MKPETQQAKFALEALPDLFHQAPDKFLKLLERDGNRLLQFYWDEVGKRMKLEAKTIPFGMDFVLHRPNSITTIALVTLPGPAYPGDGYFTALIYRPTRITMFLHVRDVSRVLVLVQAADGEGNTELVDVDRKLNREVIGSGVLPRRDAFYEAVLKELKD